MGVHGLGLLLVLLAFEPSAGQRGRQEALALVQAGRHAEALARLATLLATPGLAPADERQAVRLAVIVHKADYADGDPEHLRRALATVREHGGAFTGSAALEQEHAALVAMLEAMLKVHAAPEPAPEPAAVVPARVQEGPAPAPSVPARPVPASREVGARGRGLVIGGSVSAALGGALIGVMAGALGRRIATTAELQRLYTADEEQGFRTPETSRRREALERAVAVADGVAAGAGIVGAALVGAGIGLVVKGKRARRLGWTDGPGQLGISLTGRF